MQSAPGTGLAVGGIGVGIATYVGPALGIALPRTALIVLGVIAALMIAAGGWLEFAARRGRSPQPPDVQAHAMHTGAGSVSGNIISHSTVHVATQPHLDSQQTDQFRRAIANAETELERARGQIEAAKESGQYRRRFPIPGTGPHQALSDVLADRDLSAERQQLSRTYHQFERLNHRMKERKWSGAMPEMTIPDVRGEDRLDEVRESIENSLDTLSRLRTRF